MPSPTTQTAPKAAPPKRDIKEVWIEYKKTKTEPLRNILMENYLHLVRYNAERIHVKLPDEVELDDLMSAGIFGLMDAIAAFDLDRGVKFETYCAPRIRGAILDELRSMDWVPRLVRSRAHKLDSASKQLEVELGRAPTNDEIAKRLKTKADAMIEKLKTGGSLQDVAAQDELKVETASGVKRGDPTENLSALTINAIFRTPKGATGSAEGVQATQRVVFRVQDIKTPELDMDSSDAKRISDALRRTLADELLAGYAERLERDVGVSINPSALNQVTGGGSTN